MDSFNCPLCGANEIAEYSKDKNRSFLQCCNCDLVFVPKYQYLTTEAEKAEYDLHQNSPDDQYYRKFLSKMFVPMHKLLKEKSDGLDFGSGPGPTLSLMFAEAGHNMSIFDHFYAADPTVLDKKYEFITATEVFEHLHNPQRILEQLWSCLKEGGSLGIMTKFLPDQMEKFNNWAYKRDMTHVCFYTKSTFAWIAEQLRADVSFYGKDVVILRKK